MTKLLDWKFLVTLAVTLASVITPIWLWRADLESRSLHFVVLSRTSLQPTVGPGVPDLKVALDGAELSSPALTVVRLSNEGARPIPASDFEGPLRLVIGAPSTLVRVSVTELSPTDLSPSLTTELNSVGIAPMLLNPGDSITFAILTSGIPKTLESKARIAGIRTVPVEETPTHPLRPVGLAFAGAAALVCMICAAFFIRGLPSKGTYLRPRAAVLITLVSGTAGMLIVELVLKRLGVESDWKLFAAAIVLMLFAQPLSHAINRSTDSEKDAGSVA